MSDQFMHTSAETDVHAMGEMHEHPTWKEYKWVAVILTVITALEVWVYYTPLQNSPVFVPLLLALSVIKFAIVVLFYMHLKYDHKLFKALFTGPLIIAMTTVVALYFLLGHYTGH